MTAAVLIPAAKSLRAAIDVWAPGRDKKSDGWIGDTAHQHETSDHNPDETGSVPIHDADHVNEVHAVDVDNNLRVDTRTVQGKPIDPMDALVGHLVFRSRIGVERRLRYVIWNHVIWSASAGWWPKPYKGASPHTEHAHFSFSYDTALEASAASWHLEDVTVALTDPDKKYIADQIAAQLKAALPAIGEAVWLKARRSPEFLSDTEKNELIDRTAAKVWEGAGPTKKALD